ncbi:hypothetical protein C8Q80DRAFT_636121 [Daedaleopsis nitida]|nr:hypothetical protein C8Q80DRAFT_636121 [Daedaleopsis nitida]
MQHHDNRNDERTDASMALGWIMPTRFDPPSHLNHRPQSADACSSSQSTECGWHVDGKSLAKLSCSSPQHSTQLCVSLTCHVADLTSPSAVTASGSPAVSSSPTVSAVRLRTSMCRCFAPRIPVNPVFMHMGFILAGHLLRSKIRRHINVHQVGVAFRTLSCQEVRGHFYMSPYTASSISRWQCLPLPLLQYCHHPRGSSSIRSLASTRRGMQSDARHIIRVRALNPGRDAICQSSQLNL